MFLQKYMQSKTNVIDKFSKLSARSLSICNYSTWLKGKKTGESSLVVELHFLPFFSQMQCGVMTELGLRRGKISIMKGFHFKTNPILNEINELVMALDEGYDKISREQQMVFKDEFFSDGEGSIESWREIKACLNKLEDILGETNRRSSKTFIYSNKKEIFQIQIAFLTIGETLLKGRILPFLT